MWGFEEKYKTLGELVKSSNFPYQNPTTHGLIYSLTMYRRWGFKVWD